MLIDPYPPLAPLSGIAGSLTSTGFGMVTGTLEGTLEDGSEGRAGPATTTAL